MGISTVGTFPVQELRDDSVALGGHAGSAFAVSDRSTATPARRPLAVVLSPRQIRSGGRSVGPGAGGVADHPDPETERPASTQARGVQYAAHVLDTQSND